MSGARALAVVLRTVAGVSLALTVLAGTGSTAPPAALPVPPDFPMAKADTSPGQVTFSHAAHRAKVAKCSACHMRDVKMKRGASPPLTLAAKQEGKLCAACHDGQATIAGTIVFSTFDACDRCHK